MCCSSLSVKGGMVSVLKNYLSFEDWENINIIYVPTHIEKNKLFVAIYFVIAYVKIFFLCLFRKVDIAHLHTAERGSFYRKALIAQLCRKFGIKAIFHHHAAEFEEFYELSTGKQQDYINKQLELADLNIVLSKRLIPMITKKASSANVTVLYNAVKTYNVNPYNVEAKDILFLGRLGERKGTYDLLQALKNNIDRLPVDTQIYLCGDGDVEKVKRKILEFQLDTRISYIGWVDSQNKKNIYPNIAINVLPSYNEGLPMSILETMAYGIPNISTNIASIPEVLSNNVNGCCIEPGDVDALGECIIKLLNDNEIRSEYSKQSYNQIIDKFSLEQHIANIKKIYGDLYHIN